MDAETANVARERFSFACDILESLVSCDDVVEGIRDRWQHMARSAPGKDMNTYPDIEWWEVSPENLFRMGLVSMLMVDHYYRFLDTHRRDRWCATALEKLRPDTETNDIPTAEQTMFAIGMALIETAQRNIGTNFMDVLNDNLPIAVAVDDDLAAAMGFYVAATTMVVVVLPEERKQAAEGALLMARKTRDSFN